MSYKKGRIDKSSNCHKEIKFKDNCDLNCCDNLIVRDSDIYEAECVPVVTEKIFDSIIDLSLGLSQEKEIRNGEINDEYFSYQLWKFFFEVSAY